MNINFDLYPFEKAGLQCTIFSLLAWKSNLGFFFLKGSGEGKGRMGHKPIGPKRKTFVSSIKASHLKIMFLIHFFC